MVHSGVFLEKNLRLRVDTLFWGFMGVAMTINIYNKIVIKNWQLGIARDKARNILL